jgi:hypothetical protein
MITREIEQSFAEVRFIKEDCTYPAINFAYLLLKLEYLRYHYQRLESYAKVLEEDYDDAGQLFYLAKRMESTQDSLKDTKKKIREGYEPALHDILKGKATPEMSDLARLIITGKKEIMDFVERD